MSSPNTTGTIELKDGLRCHADDVFVDTDVLQPGDLIFSDGGSLTSEAIKASTGGEWSHVAFVVNKHYLLEAADEVVGLVQLPIDQYVRIGQASKSLTWLLGAKRATLVRLPDSPFPGMSDESLISRAYKLNGYDYPAWSALVGVLDHRAGRLVRAMEAEEAVAGPFCSQLVCDIHKLANFPLHDPQGGPASESPNSLWRRLMDRTPRPEVLEIGDTFANVGVDHRWDSVPNRVAMWERLKNAGGRRTDALQTRKIRRSQSEFEATVKRWDKRMCEVRDSARTLSELAQALRSQQ